MFGGNFGTIAYKALAGLANDGIAWREVAMRPLPAVQSSAGASANTCVGHSCGRAWYWAGLFEPPAPAETVTYTLSFRRGEVIDSWYGGYNSKLGSVEVALIPLPAGEGIDEANGAVAGGPPGSTKT